VTGLKTGKRSHLRALRKAQEFGFTDTGEKLPRPDHLAIRLCVYFPSF